ncbi:hypothetical protein CA54_18040 [Symmachiella macrocystis]|uniref:Uncharacterized protein n=1 Tax=Symmachiella macrocystis TaxID=2527985 RepID=A0A5C6BLP8_9PLAN|nr:hypothetical protein CA54_18040 [Symmachiella macrocystis]
MTVTYCGSDLNETSTIFRTYPPASSGRYNRPYTYVAGYVKGEPAFALRRTV